MIVPSLPLKISGRALIANVAGEILLLRRVASSRHFAGLWEFPGGKNDPGEEFAAALLREVKEETSLTVELGRGVGVAEHALADRRIAFVMVEAAITGGTLTLSSEHDAFAWVSRAELPAQALCPQFAKFAAEYACGAGTEM